MLALSLITLCIVNFVYGFTFIDVGRPDGFDQFYSVAVRADYVVGYGPLSAQGGMRTEASLYQISTKARSRLPGFTGDLGVDDCMPLAVNSAGVAVGVCTVTGSWSNQAAVVWKDGKAHKVVCEACVVGGAYIQDINEEGYGVGVIHLQSPQISAFLMHPDLTSEQYQWPNEIPNLRYLVPNRINAHRDVVGNLMMANGDQHGFLFINNAPRAILLDVNSTAYWVSDDASTIAGGVLVPGLGMRACTWKFNAEEERYVLQMFEPKTPSPNFTHIFAMNSVGDALALSYEPQYFGERFGYFKAHDKEDFISLNDLLPRDAQFHIMGGGNCNTPSLDDRRQLAGCGQAGLDRNRWHGWALQL